MDSGIVFILAMLIGASLLVVGLGVGYWRGLHRRLVANQTASDSMDNLLRIGQAILGAQLNLNALCEIVYHQCTRVIDTSNFQIGLFADNDYVIKIWLQDAQRRPEQRFRGSGSGGLVGWIRENMTGMLIRDFEAEWDSLPVHPRNYMPRYPAKSAIFAPLIAGGEVIGVIAAQSADKETFSERDLRDLTVLANQAAGSIHNAQLFEAARARARRLRLIGDVTRQITAVQPLPDLFEQIVSLLNDTFNFYAVNIYTIEEPSQDIVLGASTVSDAKLGFGRVRIKHSEGIIGWVATRGETAVVPDVDEDDRYLSLEGLPDTKSEVVVPLVVEGVVLGVLDVQSNQPDSFDKEDVETLELLAAQLALAIQEAFTYATERRQSERLNALVEAARAVVSILDIDRLLDEVVDLITDHFNYDRVHLFIRHQDYLVFRNGSGVHSERWLMDNLAYDINTEGIIAGVARHAETVVVQNVKEDERYIVGPGLDDTLSEMAVPILMGKRVLGVLDIQTTQTDAFRRQDQMLVEALADTVAIALRNASLFANEKRRRILSETLREVSTVLASALDLESVLQQILLGMERVVDYTAALILLRDNEDEPYHISAVHGITTADDELWDKRIEPDADLDQAIEQLLIVNKDPLDQLPGTGPLTEDTLSVPLNIGNLPIGYLAIKRVAAQQFTAEEQEIITTFASQAAVAIINAQLYMAQKEEAWISTALLEVAKATGQSLSLDELLETVARITLLLAGVEWCAILLADGEVYRLAQVAGIAEETIDQVRGFAIDSNDWLPLQEMIDTELPVVMNNDTPRPSNLPLEVEVMQAVLMPLFTKGEFLGAMLIGQGPTSDILSDRKVELLAGIANQAALAIDGAQLYTAQQEEAWVTTVLLQVAEAVNLQYDLDSTLETIVRLMTMLVGVERCVLFRWQREERRFVGIKAAGLNPDSTGMIEGLEMPVEEDIFLEAIVEAKVTISAGLGKGFDVPSPLHALFDGQPILGIPLVVHNHPVAAMFVDDMDLEGRSGQRRMDILTGVAYQSALAIQTASLQEEALAARGYEREIEVARDIQLSLLPEKPPSIEGWDIAAYYRPARLVGGDFYDFIPLSNGHYAFVIADVADKGIPAAMFMTVCRTLIRATASSQKSPVETLDRVNHLLVRDSRSDLFFTSWFGILDPYTGVLRYTSGGHNPPLLVKAQGHVEELRIKGMALGIIEPVVLNEAQTVLEPDDVLLAYTDGLTEAPRADMVEFGETEVYVTTIKHRHLGAEQMVKKIVASVDRFTRDQPAFDDMTLFAIKCNLNKVQQAAPGKDQAEMEESS